MSNSPIPERRSLASECARVMRQRIEEGEWTGYLPGERRLAEALMVGRDTVRLALKKLEKEGVLTPTTHGLRRRVLTRKERRKQSGKPPLRVGMLSTWSLERLPQPTLLEVDSIRMALEPLGGTLRVISPPWFRSARPASRLRELLRQENCQAWILHRSTAEIQHCMEQEGVPCLIRGYPHEGVGLPHLDVDWCATARHAAATLWRLGHRRVALLVPPDALMGVTAAINGVQTLGEPDFNAYALEEDGSAEGVGKVLGHAFQSKTPPSAVIAIRSRQAVTALSWLQMSGLRVPERVSLLSLAHEPYLNLLLPKMTGYWVSPEKVARHLVRRLESLLQDPNHTGASPWITPEFRKGASISPAK